MCIGSGFMTTTGEIKLLNKQLNSIRKNKMWIEEEFTQWWLSAPIAGFTIPFLSCKQEKASIM